MRVHPSACTILDSIRELINIKILISLTCLSSHHSYLLLFNYRDGKQNMYLWTILRQISLTTLAMSSPCSLWLYISRLYLLSFHPESFACAWHLLHQRDFFLSGMAGAFFYVFWSLHFFVRTYQGTKNCVQLHPLYEVSNQITNHCKLYSSFLTTSEEYSLQ